MRRLESLLPSLTVTVRMADVMLLPSAIVFWVSNLSSARRKYSGSDDARVSRIVRRFLLAYVPPRMVADQARLFGSCRVTVVCANAAPADAINKPVATAVVRMR